MEPFRSPEPVDMAEMCEKGEEMIAFSSWEDLELMFSAMDGIFVDYLMEWLLTYKGIL